MSDLLDLRSVPDGLFECHNTGNLFWVLTDYSFARHAVQLCSTSDMPIFGYHCWDQQWTQAPDLKGLWLGSAYPRVRDEPTSTPVGRAGSLCRSRRRLFLRANAPGGVPHDILLTDYTFPDYRAGKTFFRSWNLVVDVNGVESSVMSFSEPSYLQRYGKYAEEMSIKHWRKVFD